MMSAPLPCPGSPISYLLDIKLLLTQPAPCRQHLSSFWQTALLSIIFRVGPCLIPIISRPINQLFLSIQQRLKIFFKKKRSCKVLTGETTIWWVDHWAYTTSVNKLLSLSSYFVVFIADVARCEKAQPTPTFSTAFTLPDRWGSHT